MALTQAAYKDMMAGLLPRGQAWNREPWSVLMRFIGALATEFAGLDARSDDMISESDPRAAREILPEWEAAAGLPDACTTPASTLQERRDALVRKITGIGGQTPAYYLSLAARLGYDVSLREYRPFVAGISRCGTQHLNGGHAVRHIWRVTINGPRLTWFRTGGSRTGEKLLSIATAADLECVLRALKPAHTQLAVAYQPSEARWPTADGGQIPLSDAGRIPLEG